jgi:hypothetical protein
MSNLKPHKFTKEEQSRGGKKAGIVRLNTANINRSMQAYLDNEGVFDADNFTNDFLSLTPKDRLHFLMAWMPFEKPKLATIEQVIEVANLEIPKEERQKRIMKLIDKKVA